MGVLARLLILLSAFCISGIPEGMWQAYAWTSMLIERAPEMGVKKALEDTISGESPCGICAALEEHRDQKKEYPPREEIEVKNAVEKFLDEGSFLVLYEPPFIFARYTAILSRANSWVVELSSPPPDSV